MKKRLMLVMGLAVAALGIGATAAVLGTTPAVFTRATGETRSIVLTAADFTTENGEFSKGGITFHYEKFSVDGNTVTIATGGLIFMTMAHYSGESVSEGGLMGNGFTALSFTDYYQDGVGSVAFGKKATEDGVSATYTVAASMDLTHEDSTAAVPSDNRRRIHINAAHTLSFTKITYSYECVEAQPAIEISGDTHVDKDHDITLTAATERVDGSATYNWISSDTDVATVVGNGKSATVTGVAAGEVTITVQAIVDTVVVASDTFNITVLSTDMPTEELPVIVQGNGPTKIEGAGIWVYLDNTALGITGANAESILADITISATSEKEAAQPYVDGGSNALTYDHHTFDDYGANTVRLYIVMNNGVPTDWDMTITVAIKLTIKGTNYVKTISFFNGAYQNA